MPEISIEVFNERPVIEAETRFSESYTRFFETFRENAGKAVEGEVARQQAQARTATENAALANIKAVADASSNQFNQSATRSFGEEIRASTTPENITQKSTVAANNAIENKLPASTLETIRAYWRSARLKFVDIFQTSSTVADLDRVTAEMDRILKDPNSSQSAIDTANATYTAAQQRFERELAAKYQLKVEAESGKSGWEKFKSAVKMAAVLGSGVALWFALSKQAFEASGCFVVYTVNGVTSELKLSQCSEKYYQVTETNNLNCKCQEQLVPLKTPVMECKDPNCLLPFCLGKCAGSPDATHVCNYPSLGYGMMCTTGSIRDDGFVTYEYKEISILTIVGNDIGKVIQQAGQGAGDIFAGFFSALVGPIGIGIIIAILAVVAYLVLK